MGSVVIGVRILLSWSLVHPCCVTHVHRDNTGLSIGWGSKHRVPVSHKAWHDKGLWINSEYIMYLCKEFIVEPSGHGRNARTHGVIVELKMWIPKTKLTFHSSEIIYFCLFIENLLDLLGLCNCYFCLSLFYVISSGCMTHIWNVSFEVAFLVRTFTCFAECHSPNIQKVTVRV